MTKTNEVNRAKAILKTAKEFDIYEPAIPDVEEKLISEADYVYNQAVEAWDNNIRGKAVTAVKFAAEVTGIDEGRDIEHEVEPTGWEDLTVSEMKSEVDELIAMDAWDTVRDLYEFEKAHKNRKMVIKHIDDQYAVRSEVEEKSEELEEGLSGAIESDLPSEPDKTWFDEAFEAQAYAEAKARKQNLPYPLTDKELPDPTMQSGSVATVNLDELQERLNDAQLCLAAATWQASIAQIDEEHCERVADHYYNKAFKSYADTAKTATEAKAWAEEADNVVKWRAKQAKANGKLVTYKSLKEIYKGYWDTASRVFAMKVEERERSRNR